MSNGGGEAGRERTENIRNTKLSGDGFARAVAKIAVAQICESAGFQTFQQSALEMLSDVALSYMKDIGSRAHSYAGMAGRAECNVFDVIHGLEDIGCGLGFAGASDVDRCLASSGVVKEVINYIDEAEIIPFAYSIRPFPVFKRRETAPSFLQAGEEPPSEHIPAWLPAFPQSKVYLQSAGSIERENGIQIKKKEEDVSLVNFKRHDVSEMPSTVDTYGATTATQGVEVNPYLALPLQVGEKDVGLFENPSKRSIEAVMRNPSSEDDGSGGHIPVFETFGPALQLLESRTRDSKLREIKEHSNRRSLVQFKIGLGKKSLGARVNFTSDTQDPRKADLWFGEDDEKDERKRKAKRILRESMENVEELA